MSRGGEGVACGAGEEAEEAESGAGIGAGADIDRVMPGRAWVNEDVRMNLDKADEKTSQSSPTLLLPLLLLLLLYDCSHVGDVSYVVKETLNVFGRTRRGREVFSRGALLWSSGSALSKTADRRRGFSAETGGMHAGDGSVCLAVGVSSSWISCMHGFAREVGVPSAR